MSGMNLLLVGFDGSDWKPARRAMDLIAACTEAELESDSIVSMYLPAIWQGAFEPMRQMLSQDWDAVVLLAEKDCKGIAVERIAINEMDPRAKDAEGRRPPSKVIDGSGEPGYWTTLPYRELCERLNAADLPAIASHSAGAGLANFLFYKTMQHLQSLEKAVPAGLIHVGNLDVPADSERAKRLVGAVLSSLKQGADTLSVDVQKLRVEKDA